MRGGDAGWGHEQGEAEEEKAERESPALEYTATTRRQREGERHTHTRGDRETGWFFFSGGGAKGAFRRCGHELNRNTGRGRDRAPIIPKFYCQGGKLAPPGPPFPPLPYPDPPLSLTVLSQIELHPKPRPTPSCSCCSTPPPPHRSGNRDAHGDP